MDLMLKAGLIHGLRRNIKNIWFSSLFNAPRTSAIQSSTDDLKLLKKRSNITDFFSLVSTDVQDDKEILTHNFIAPTQATHWFDYWIRERRIWWKRLCYDCSKFDVEIVSEKQSSLIYNNDTHLEEIEFIDDFSKAFNIIRCRLHLDRAAVCLLNDASTDHGLRIHYRLCPYQISVIAMNQAMFATSQKLVQDLKLERIAVYPKCQLVKTSLLSTLSVMDNLGVFLNIILSEETEQTGIVGVRCRDTCVLEKMHLLGLPEYLVRCLKTDGRVIAEEFSAGSENVIPAHC